LNNSSTLESNLFYTVTSKTFTLELKRLLAHIATLHTEVIINLETLTLV